LNRFPVELAPQSEKDESELLEESTRIRRLKLGAENQRRQYAKEILDLKDILRQSQEQVELLTTEVNAMQDLVDEAQNSVNGRQVIVHNTENVFGFVDHVYRSTSWTSCRRRFSRCGYMTPKKPQKISRIPLWP
jgi:hypothetical protein